MAEQSFRVIITAVDRATAVMRGINRSVAGLARPFTDVTAAAGQFVEAAGFEKVAKAAEGVWKHVEHIGHAMLDLAGPAAALGGIASAGGLLEIAKSAAEYNAQLYKASQITGIQVAQLARLHYVAEQSEVSTEILDKGLARLNLTIAAAAAGQNKQALIMFQRLHIALRDGSGHIRTAASVYGDLAEAVRKNENATVRAAIVGAAFGQRMGAEQIPMLRKGREEIARLGLEFDKLHGPITDASAKAGEEAFLSWKRLTAATEGLKNAIGTALFPAMQKLIEPLTEWLVANRQLVATNVADFVSNIGNTLRQIDWAGIGQSLRVIGNAFGTLFRTLGPVNTALAGTGLVMSPLLLAFGSLGRAISTVSARLALFALAPVTAALGNFITALRAGYGAMAAFDLVMAANPVGLVIAGLAALAGAAYLVYRYWTPIKEFFKTLWADIRPYVQPLIDATKWIADKLSGLAFGTGAAAAMASQIAAAQPAPAVTTQQPVVSRPVGMLAGGQQNITVDFKNMPRGASVRTTGTGANPPNLDVGVRFAPGL